MSAKRYTERLLTADLDNLNADLAAKGIDAAFVVSPRNGYCAVDWYKPSIRNDRTNPGWSGVESMVEGGTPKECFQTCTNRYYQWVARHAQQTLQAQEAA